MNQFKLKTIKARQAEADTLLDLSGKLFWLVIASLVALVFKGPEFLVHDHGNAYFCSVIVVSGICVLLSIYLRIQALIKIDSVQNL